MDYPCAKFGELSLSRFGFIDCVDRQTNRITDIHGSSLCSRDYRRREQLYTCLQNDNVPRSDEVNPVAHNGFAQLAVGLSEAACERIDLARGG